jgi:hypothetical protein
MHLVACFIRRIILIITRRVCNFISVLGDSTTCRIVTRYSEALYNPEDDYSSSLEKREIIKTLSPLIKGKLAVFVNILC